MKVKTAQVMVICTIFILLALVSCVTTILGSSSSLIGEQIPSYYKSKFFHPSSLNVSIGVIKPIFTAAAYNNAFYVFYKLKSCILHLQCPGSDDLNLLTGKIPSVERPTIRIATLQGQLLGYLQTEVGRLYPHIKGMLPNGSIHVITDAVVNDAPTANALNKAYNILIVGHQEYVTQKEYDNLRDFVANGGTLICLDGNIFYAEVSYNEPNQTVTLINGHGFGFNGKYAYPGLQERWENETSNWLGSNFYSLPYASVNPQHEFQRISLVYSNNPFNYTGHEEQYVTNPNVKIIMNYGARWYVQRGADLSTSPLGYLPQPPTIATYEKPYGKGRVIVFGIYSDELLSNPEFLKFFDRILLENASSGNQGLQAFLMPGQNQTNIKTFRLSISQNKNNTIATDAISKGLALAASGNFEGALKFYDKALAAHSNNTGLLINEGNALSRTGNYSGAIKYYDKALAAGKLNNATSISNLFPLLINKGNGLLTLGKYNEALSSYNQALTLRPSVGILIIKASTLFKIGNYTSAIEYYDKALALAPKNAAALEGKLIAVKALKSKHG